MVTFAVCVCVLPTQLPQALLEGQGYGRSLATADTESMMQIKWHALP
jgi:hypothetical protein